MALRTFLTRDRSNATIAWVFLGFLTLVAAAQALSGAYLWCGLALAAVALALLPVVVARDWTVTVPWVLLGLVSVPLLVELLGLVTPRSALDNVAAYVALSIVALMAAVDLSALSEVDLSPRFAVVFVVATTMAAGGVWTVLRWLSDVYLGTNFLRSENGVMWDLVASTVGGVVGGLLFEGYLHERESDGGADGVLSGGSR
jgi:hypothetical protein